MVSERNKERMWAWGLYTLLFGLLFLQFPLKDSLPGNFDTWFMIAYSNGLMMNLSAWWNSVEATAPLYPVLDYYSYGESAALGAFIYSAIKAIIGSDIWTVYGVILLVFSTTATSVFMLARFFTSSFWPPFLAGILFCGANFTLAHIDSIHTLFFAPGFLAIYLWLKFLSTGHWRLSVMAALFGVVQLYISAYAFLLVHGVIVLAFLFYFRPVKVKKHTLHFVVGLVVLVAGCIPFFNLYAKAINSGDFYRPLITEMEPESGSLELHDLIRFLPGERLYPVLDEVNYGEIAHTKQLAEESKYVKKYAVYSNWLLSMGSFPQPEEIMGWATIRRSAGIGVLIYIMAFIGLFTLFKYDKRLAIFVSTLIVSTFLISLGPFLKFGNTIIPMPTYWLYHYFPTSLFFRVPLRAFFLVLLALSVLSAIGIEGFIFNGSASRLWVVPFVIILFMAENLPKSLPAFPAKEYVEAPKLLTDGNFSLSNEDVIVHLPSSIGFSYRYSDRALFAYNREVMYMNWQTQYKHHTVNGVNGYIPRSRLKMQGLLEQLPSYGAVRDLKLQGVTTICYHTDMELPEEKNGLAKLKRSPYFIPLSSNEVNYCFRLK